MSLENQNKIKYLLTNWLDKTIATSNWLLEKGISPQLAKRYVESGWIKAIGHGAFKKLDDDVLWQGGVYALQTQLHLPIHVGGLSALSFHGVAHYMRLGREKLYLFSSPDKHLPKWFSDYDWEQPIVVVKTAFLPAEIGIKPYQYQSIQINHATVERAVLELLYLTPKQIDILECYQIIEGLHNLRPSLLQTLLEECTSVKVKRLFLFMADKAQLPVMKHLNLQKIDLGKGDRSIVSNGQYDSKYKLVLPSELVKNEPSI
tara:strand:- start:37620 stop:38399 length:780 start_codon:yes stop_codon:yes gene_type:complete